MPIAAGLNCRLGRVHSLLAHGSDPVEKASRPAPAIHPSVRERISASSLMMHPRPMLNRKAPGYAATAAARLHVWKGKHPDVCSMVTASLPGPMRPVLNALHHRTDCVASVLAV